MASGVISLKTALVCPRHSPKINLEGSPRIKLERLVCKDRFNKKVEWTELLLTAATEGLIQLNVPETLVSSENGSVFLFCDKKGVLRQRSGARTNEQFFLLCAALRSQVENLNTKGLRFPKYVTFTSSGAEFTIDHKKDLKTYINKSSYRAQRFIIPSNFFVRKSVIRWSRTKPLQKFILSSRLSPTTRMLATGLALLQQSSLNVAVQSTVLKLQRSFIASMKNIETCDIVTDSRLTDAEEIILGTVKGLLETYAIDPEDQIEEFVFSTLESQNGKTYVLNCSRLITTAKIRTLFSMPESTACRRASLPHIAELASRLLKSGTLVKPLVKPEESPRGDYFSSLTYRRRSSLPLPCPQNPVVTKHIREVVGTFDKLCAQTKEHKQALALREKVRFQGYPHDFLPKVIHQMYKNIMERHRLAKYFTSGQHIREHLEGSMHQVFVQGRYPSKIREIHSKLNISDTDFSVYIREFKHTFLREGATLEDSEQAIDYLEGFRDCIVSKRRCSVEDFDYEY